jgi:hypothetical protein
MQYDTVAGNLALICPLGWRVERGRGALPSLHDIGRCRFPRYFL